jgi:hypothetical protein
VFFEHDVFEGESVRYHALQVVDLKLNNATSIGGGAYTQYSVISTMSFGVHSSTIAAVIGGKTFRTPWVSWLDRLPSCDDI